MPVINSITDNLSDIVEWRRDFHRNPELLFDVQRTARKVEERLKEFGVDEIVTGLGRTGVVGVIKGRSTASGRVIGLRADMDALPITERTGREYASQVSGRMHACGHDGHTSMLLGAARHLAGTRNFDGTVITIFQPAEEGGGGGRAMVQDGLMDRFGIEQVFGLHNFPGLAAGNFAIRPGGIMAATDEIEINIEGVGGHAAMPHKAVDPILCGAQMISGLQSLISRNVNPTRSAVLSITVLRAGEATNVIPRTAEISGTVRTLDEDVRDLLEQRLTDFVPQFAKAFGANATLSYRRGYPVTVNSEPETEFAANVAADVVGENRIDRAASPTLGGEDFSYMLQARPGAYILLGQGDTAGLHEDTYDFNDEIIPVGVSYWVRLTEMALPLS